MATTCDKCGNRTNEVKSGGGIEPKGIRIEVDVNGREDHSRDVLKVSEKVVFVQINCIKNQNFVQYYGVHNQLLNFS